MGEKQNKKEYERCKEKGLLHRLSMPILEKFGTEEEKAARTDRIQDKPEEEAKPEKKKKKRY